MRLFGYCQDDAPHPRPLVDQMAVRDELTRTDPDFARVRQVHHDALNVLTAKGIRDGIALRREREFWARQGEP